MVMVKELECGLQVNELEFQTRYFVNFWSNTFGKGIGDPYPSNWLKSITTIHL